MRPNQTDEMPIQVENLRSAVRYLRNENALLKSRDLYTDLKALPPIRYRSATSTTTVHGTGTSAVPSDETVPGLDESSLDSPSSDTSSLPPLTPSPRPTRHALETESKLFYKEIARYHSRPKIVDLSSTYAPSEAADGDAFQETNVIGSSQGHAWRSRRKMPDTQIWEFRRDERELEKRLEGLKGRMRALGRGG